MTTEKREKLEYFLSSNHTLFLAEEDKAKKSYYRGKVMGAIIALEAFGYTIKEDRTKVCLLDGGKSMGCVCWKIVKKPRNNRGRRKMGG